MSSPSDRTDLVAAEIFVSGMVQGVGYRFFTERVANELKLAGWVRNLPDGRVQVDVEGPRARVEDLLGRLRSGPRLSSVTDVSVAWKSASGTARGFSIKG